MFYSWYTQNEDVPSINDASTVEYLDGVLTLDCNGDHKSFVVAGPEPGLEDLHRVEDEFGDEPVCPDVPRSVAELLGLTLGEETDLPVESGLRPPVF